MAMLGSTATEPRTDQLPVLFVGPGATGAAASALFARFAGPIATSLWSSAGDGWFDHTMAREAARRFGADVAVGREVGLAQGALDAELVVLISPEGTFEHVPLTRYLTWDLGHAGDPAATADRLLDRVVRLVAVLGLRGEV